MTSSNLPKQLRLLSVVAHPHDVMHVSGTCANHVERGDAVTVVVATGGLRMHNEQLADELLKPPEERNREITEESIEAYGERKAQEFDEACRVLGLPDVRILPFLDSPLEVTDELLQALAEILYEVRPHIVVTHAPYPGESKGRVNIQPDDHVSTGIAVHSALGIVGRAEYGSERQPHRVAEIYYDAVATCFWDADLCIDISDQAAKRVRAEVLFRTQGFTPEMARKHIEIRSGAYGFDAGVAYAEIFFRSRAEVQKYLPISDYALQMADEPTKEQFVRISQQVSETEIG